MALLLKWRSSGFKSKMLLIKHNNNRKQLRLREKLMQYS
jgi:hypothetical protein